MANTQPAVNSNELLDRADRKRLFQIAPAMVKGEGFISPYADDNPRSTPKATLREAEKQSDLLKDWGVEIAAIAKKIAV